MILQTSFASVIKILLRAWDSITILINFEIILKDVEIKNLYSH